MPFQILKALQVKCKVRNLFGIRWSPFKVAKKKNSRGWAKAGAEHMEQSRSAVVNSLKIDDIFRGAGARIPFGTSTNPKGPSITMVHT